MGEKVPEKARGYKFHRAGGVSLRVPRRPPAAGPTKSKLVKKVFEYLKQE
jgi:hypothetical protein